MLIRWFLPALSATLCSSQYAVDMAMRADVTFNNDNDRFDVGDIINEQNKQFKEFAQMDYEDTRRHLPLVDILKQDRRRHKQSQKHRRYKGSEEDFVQSYQPRMVDYNNELGQYNKNLENFRRQKPPELIARRNNVNNGIAIPAVDNINSKGNLIAKELLQGVIVDELKSKNDSKYNNDVSETVKSEIKYKVMPKTANDEAKVIRYIDTKGRRNNFKQTAPKNHEGESNVFSKDPTGVILKNLHGGKEPANGRRMADLKADDETLLNYAVPLRMTVKGYLELPNE